MKLAHVHFKNRHLEPVWHVQLALVIAIVLQLSLNTELTLGPKYVMAGLEVALLVLLAIIKPKEKPNAMHLRHTLAILLIALISAANISSLILVVHSLFGSNLVSGKELIISGLTIFLTNIIIFGLWYWELDSNGVQGQDTNVEPVDFLFPQMSMGSVRSWRPTFFDYLYVSVTNASAFSPTDTLPLTHRAKLLMSTQSIASLMTVILVTARAVNILA